MATVTGAMAVVEQLLNAQLESYYDKAKMPWSYDRPRNFLALSMFLQNRDSQHTVEAGTDVVTLFNPEIEEHGGPKVPAAPHRTTSGGRLYTMKSALTEYEFGSEISWHELNLNSGSPDTPSGSKKIWDIAEKRNQNFIVGMMKKLERDLFAVPTAEMFSGDATGKYPLKSIWTGCNEFTPAHYTGAGGTGTFGDGLFPGMTDQQGLNPADAAFARRDGLGGATQLSATKLKYATAGDATTGDAHLVDRFQDMLDLLQWDGVPMAGEFADAMDIRPRVIQTSREGASLLRRTVRAHGELFALINPIGDLAQAKTQFGGIPIAFSDTIRSAAIYPDISGGVGAASTATPVTEFDTAGLAGARYYFFDPEATNLFLHKDRAFEIGQWKNLDQLNEDMFRRLAKVLGQIHHTRFATHGILSPSADISGYTAIN